jgi:PAS domain S-box-containing protein
MINLRADLRTRYRKALMGFVNSDDDERPLADGYEVGRAVLAEGQSLLDLLALHRSLMPTLLTDVTRKQDVAERYARADEFLAQAIMPFEMTHQGWHQTVDRLRTMYDTLEQQVAARTSELRESEQRFKDVAEVAGDWIWETSVEHRFTFFAGDPRSVIDALGLTPDDTIGKTRWEMAGADPEIDEHWRQHLRDLGARRPFRQFRYTVTNSEGIDRYISTSGKPVIDQAGVFRGYRGTATDETDLVEAMRRAEQTDFLSRVNAELEERVRARTEDLKQSAARLQELHLELLHASRLNAMGQMSTSLAHELNQPLAAITNYVKACATMLAADDRAKAARVPEILAKAGEQTARAAQIIRRLRNFVEKGKTDQRAESLADMIDEARALATVGAAQQGVKVTVAVTPGADVAVVDKIQIEQVIVNLARNAIEAMAESERRELTIATALHAPGLIEVRIADTGPGLPDDVARQLFKPFVTTKSHGMGIGLSICQSIIEAHGGKIRAEPNPGGGTVFVFTVPAAQREPDAGGAPA